MTFEEIFQPGVAPVVGSTATILFGIVSLYFKWLMSSFKQLRLDLTTQATSYARTLSDHEVRDQTRHEENLYRFEKISVALARLGSTNGTYTRKSN